MTEDIKLNMTSIPSTGELLFTFCQHTDSLNFLQENLASRRVWTYFSWKNYSEKFGKTIILATRSANKLIIIYFLYTKLFISNVKIIYQNLSTNCYVDH